jgi:type II secretory pathway component PulJ
MKRWHKGFTLFEVLLAIVLSSFVMYGLMRLYQSSARYLERTRDMMIIDRTVCLFFNQLERDLSSAYIPYLHKVEKTEKPAEIKSDKADAENAAQEKAPESPEEQKKAQEKARAERKTFFVATFDEYTQDVMRIEGKKVELFKSLSFICTNPFGQKRTRMVRVIYLLVKDKKKSTRDNTSYQLVRKETDDLSNVKGKADEFATTVAKDKDVRSLVVADGIKGFYVEYIMLEKDIKRSDKEEKAAADKPKEPDKEWRSCSWGQHKETSGVVPQRVNVWLDMWDDNKRKTVRFNATFVVLSYPTQDDDFKVKADGGKNGKKKNGLLAKGSKINATNGPVTLTGETPDEKFEVP